MKKVLYIIILLSNLSWAFSQEISFQELNSANVMQLFGKNPSNNNSQNVLKNSQIGNENSIFVYDSNGKNLQILQQGNYNSTLYINVGNKETDLQINSIGNNNYVDITGNNSNSEGMKIRIKGNDKMIFIRNY